jgi:hypothetical protein
MSMCRIMPACLNLIFCNIAVAMIYIICLVFKSGRIKQIFLTFLELME